jgi:bleomycin hydrolase
MSINSTIDQKALDEFRKDYLDIPSRQVVKNAIMKNGIKAATLNSASIVNMQHTFSDIF